MQLELASCAPQLMRAVPSKCGAMRAWMGWALGSWRFMLTIGPSRTTCVKLRWDTTSWMLTDENKQEPGFSDKKDSRPENSGPNSGLTVGLPKRYCM